MTRSQLKSSEPAQGVIRTCAGCGAKKPQREMLRIASGQGAAPQLDFEWKRPGRGAYLCRNSKCAQTAFMRRALERTLKLNNSLSPAAREEIERAVAAGLPGILKQNDNENGKGGLR